MKFGSKAHVTLATILWTLAFAACSRVGGPIVKSVLGDETEGKVRVNAQKSYTEPALAQSSVDAAAASLDGLLRVNVNESEASITSVALVAQDGSIGNLTASASGGFAFPLPDDAFAETSISGDKGDVVNFLTQSETGQIVSFYQKVLPTLGWTPLPGAGSSEAAAARFTNERGQHLKLTILGDEALGIGANMVVIESTH